MKKETAEQIAAEILATKLGWVVALVDMTDPVNFYTDDGWKETAMRRVAHETLEGDYFLGFYETGVKLPRAQTIASEAEWLALSRTILDVSIPIYPNGGYRDGFAKWYPSKKLVRFTDEWVRVPDLAAETRPEKSDVFDWLKKHGVTLSDAHRI